MCWLCSELEVQKHINHATQLGQELSSGLFDITLEIPFPDASSAAGCSLSHRQPPMPIEMGTEKVSRWKSPYAE